MTKRLCNVPQMSVYLYSYGFALVALLILDVLRTKSRGAFTVCDKYCISHVEPVVSHCRRDHVEQADLCYSASESL